MKKPIVGELNIRSDMCWWHLPNNAGIYQSGLAGINGDNYMIAWEEEIAGPISKQMAQELFQVILYPPGSEPSPESVDPTEQDRLRKQAEHAWEIPRKDIDNGDWY